jgi:tetratricopeptide (TPR) repeat protein
VVTTALLVLAVHLLTRPRALFIGLWLGLAATLIHSLFDARQVVEIGWVLPLSFTLLGLLAATARRELVYAADSAEEEPERNRGLRVAAAAVVIVAIIGVGAVLLSVPLNALWQTNQGALAESRAVLNHDLDDAARAALLDEAIQHYTAAIELTPNWPSANRRLGNLYVRDEEFALAIPLLETAHAAEPFNQASVKGLGLAYMWEGRTADAARLFNTLNNPGEMVEELGNWAWWRGTQNQPDLAAYAEETRGLMREAG